MNIKDTALIKYFLLSYILIWIIATPPILLALNLYGIPFSSNYEEFIGSLPIYLTISIIYLSAVPSYYLPATLYFRKIGFRTSALFALKIAIIFWGLSMLLDLIFVVLISGINILTYPFNLIYLGISPVMIFSVFIAGIRTKH